jgi:hypothetical protein
VIEHEAPLKFVYPWLFSQFERDGVDVTATPHRPLALWNRTTLIFFVLTVSL